MIKGKKVLVVSAHAADYVWRSGGTIAKYIKHGAEVHVVVLSFGIRGESAAQWKKEGATYESVKENRLEETTKAAEILGIKNIEFWDLPDYQERTQQSHYAIYQAVCDRDVERAQLEMSRHLAIVDEFSEKYPGRSMGEEEPPIP